MANVVRIRRKGGEIVQGCDIYIGRACSQGGWNLSESKWYNPFPLSRYSREESLSKYREYILDKIKKDPVTYDLSELKGKTLGCWCSPEMCHGNVLIELIHAMNI